jgi:hypothetical protein
MKYAKHSMRKTRLLLFIAVVCVFVCLVGTTVVNALDLALSRLFASQKYAPKFRTAAQALGWERCFCDLVTHGYLADLDGLCLVWEGNQSTQTRIE